MITVFLKSEPMIEWFPNDCRKPNNKAITPTNHNRSKQRNAMNQPEFLAITYSLLNAQENSSVRGAIGFSFASH